MADSVILCDEGEIVVPFCETDQIEQLVNYDTKFSFFAKIQQELS